MLRQISQNSIMSEAQYSVNHPPCQACPKRGCSHTTPPFKRSKARHPVSFEADRWSCKKSSAALPQDQNLTTASIAFSDFGNEVSTNLTTFEAGSLNWDNDFFGLGGSPLSPDLPAYFTDSPSNSGFTPSTTLPPRQPDGFSVNVGDDSFDQFPQNLNLKSAFASPQEALQGVGPCSKHRKSCMVSALKILETLHVPPSVCPFTDVKSLNPVSLQPRTTEFVLSTNREIIRLILHMLECTCFTSLQLQLVLASICSKLIVWYRAIVPNSYGFLDDSMTGSESGAERVLHQPVTLGKYSIDATLEHKVRAQVVLSELRHVEALVKAISRRVRQGKHDNPWNVAVGEGRSRSTSPSRSERPNETETSRVIHKCLIDFLQIKLQKAKANINLVLHDGPAPVDESIASFDMDRQK